MAHALVVLIHFSSLTPKVKHRALCVKSWGLITLAVLLIAGTSFAGSVEGTLPDTTWTSGVINVTGDITLPSGKSLIISEGVTVVFAEDTQLIVNGLLDVKGSEEHPIIFTSPQGTTWEGIHINNSSSTSGEIEHAIIRNAYTGLKVTNSRFRVSNTDIFAEFGGMEISASSTMYINYVNIYIYTENEATAFGLSSDNSFISMLNSRIELDLTQVQDGASTPGTGAKFASSEGHVNKSYIKCMSNNPVRVNGISISSMGPAGLDVDYCGVTIQSSTDYSKAIRVDNVSPFDLKHMSIELVSGEIALDEYAMIYAIYAFSQADVNVRNSIIANFNKATIDDCVAAKIDSDVINSTISISYTDLYDVNDFPGDRVSIDNTINADPLWEDHTLYHLTEDSPCIDAGQTGNQDPDETDPDMGMHYFHQEPQSSVNNNPYTVPESFSIVDVWPNPFNSKMRCNVALPVNGHLNVAVYDILGRQVDMLTNNVHHAGTVQLFWNAERVASGVYFVRASYNNNIETRRITLVR